MRYFEDYPPGSAFELGSVVVTEAQIVDFARQFDPQEFHVDRERSVAGPFGGLIASGWHTASLMMSLLVASFLDAGTSLGSPGIDELRWPAPVRPGDTLTVKVSILEARKSRTKPDRGLLHSHIEVRNQSGVTVMTVKAMNLVRCRPAAP